MSSAPIPKVPSSVPANPAFVLARIGPNPIGGYSTPPSTHAKVRHNCLGKMTLGRREAFWPTAGKRRVVSYCFPILFEALHISRANDCPQEMARTETKRIMERRRFPPHPHAPKWSRLERTRNVIARPAAQVYSGNWRSATRLKRIRKRRDYNCQFRPSTTHITRPHVLL